MPLENKSNSLRGSAGQGRSVAVVGAGVAGVMTAYAFATRGFEVSLIDALSGPAQMCSHANAGILAVGHAKAWAGPGAINSIVKAFLGLDRSIVVGKYLDPALWRWGAEFLRNCTQEAHSTNTAALQRLSRYSCELIRAAENEMALPRDIRRDGGLYLFQDKGQFTRYTTSISNHGGDVVEILECDELVNREPGLKAMSHLLAGGVFSPTDAVGDCKLFCERTTSYLQRQENVRIHFNTRIDGLKIAANNVVALKTNRGDLPCSSVILATGVETGRITRALGFVPNIYPVKGYSGTWRILDRALVPKLPYVDETELLAVASYGDKLRVTAVAEFAGYDRAVSVQQADRLSNYVRRAFGKAVDLDSAVFWSGLRPTTPSGPPFLGKARSCENLWLTAGHGQLGWTMALGCGELLAQKIAGETTQLAGVSSTAPWIEPI
ncbi:FAD-dependent oxidoreductase [Mesorhizobium sp. BH1-1-4]|uniref:FAD-dependent oxidoreductase n=1 Tax=Mesorhizobium sp. BH1-1-4 TaxID=2876662 RepID=UPI001CD10C0B|nr:FAD-dependent oxidoreductase [Mesorhizobium sp. BH1-1-4]MBZ9993992.1 FAD-dependent oxidoreductase [Mesorhizobium sp. BH1-1-4]